MSDVLIVEDEANVRELLRHVLGRAGISFRTAFTGQQALKLAQVDWPVVVLLDLTLPGQVDGWQVWDVLAELAAGRALRVVVFAAELNPVDHMQAALRGAYGILRKPVLPGVLVATLQQALAHNGLR
jgi:CheY-like chemotaxis protein